MNYRLKILGVFIPLCLMLCFMSNTYSRYVAGTTGNLKMSFAQWQILVNNDDIINNSSSSIVLNPIIDENKYVENNKIAPSSTGYFDIEIDPSNVDVSFNYNITLDVINEDIPDLIITKYAILDNDYNGTDAITYNNIQNNMITGSLDVNNSVIASGSDEIGVVTSSSDEIQDSGFKPFTIRICFEWYEGTDETMKDDADTLVGKDAKNKQLEISANIKFEQKIVENV